MEKQNLEDKKLKGEKVEKTGEELLQEYFKQDDEKHFYHVDGYYNDHSDSGCCC